MTAILSIDNLTVDLERRRVVRADGEVVALPALSFDTLAALIDASPGVLSADELIERAWRGAIVSDETVTQRIRLLRKALGDDGRNPRYIETLRNVGYRLIPPVVSGALAKEKPRGISRGVLAGLLVFGFVLGGIWLSADNSEHTPTTSNSPSVSPSIPSGPITATDLAAQAHDLVRQRNPDSLRHAIELYEQALMLEPDNRRTQASLSLALSRSVAWYSERTEIATRAEALARQSLSDGAFFGAELALGFSLDALGKVESARAAYQRAVALDPSHYGARASLAYLLQVQGRLVEALSHNMIAYETAPPGTLDTQIASCLRLLGFRATASEWLERSDRLDPDSAHAAPTRALDLLTRNAFEQGRVVIDEAIGRGVEQTELYEYLVVLALLDQNLPQAQATLQLVPPSISDRGFIKVWENLVGLQIGDVSRDANIQLAAELREDVAAGAIWPETHLYIAMLEANAGRQEAALMALYDLSAAGYRDYLWLEMLPPLAALRGLPDYRKIVTAMRADVDRQRSEVLTAEWLPEDLKSAVDDTNAGASRR